VSAYGPYFAVFVDLHDGDTLHLNVDLGFGMIATAYDIFDRPQLSCRVYGINAPELDTDAGKKARDYANTLLHKGDIVQLVSHSWDKFGGRYDGTVTLPDGSDFAQRMLDSGNAVVMKG
jgi:endonuclease YncB( thermonuclease family)